MRIENIENHTEQINELYTFINTTCPIKESSWKAMCKLMNYCTAEKGERLLDYMKIESAVRFLTFGIVKCEDHFNEQSFVYDFRVAPIILCETVSLFNAKPSHITLEAVTKCEFIELPRIPFVELLFSKVDLAKFATLGVANYLGMTHYKQALLRTMNAEQRYKQFLREFPSVALNAKLSDIASYINITQQSLSRLRKSITWKENEKLLEALSNELALIHGIK